jgi:hypothetical protein
MAVTSGTKHQADGSSTNAGKTGVTTATTTTTSTTPTVANPHPVRRPEAAREL